MADYPFKINITTKDGTKKSFFTASLATNADTIVSASAMVDRVNNMFSASSFIESIEAPSLTSTKYNNTSEGIKFLSASVTHPNTGSIIFTDKETSDNGGLDHYEFYGTKVCSVLGLPEGVPIYTENFKLSDSSTDTTNYISGEFISDRIALKKGFKMSPQARVQSNLVWDHTFGEGFLQWVSGSNTKMSIGYNNVTDRYAVSAPSGSFNLVQSLKGFAGTTHVGNYMDVNSSSGTIKFHLNGVENVFLNTLFASFNSTGATPNYLFQILNSSGIASFSVQPDSSLPLSVIGGATFSSNDTGEVPILKLDNTNNSADGALILFEKDAYSEADNDVLGNIRWRGHDSVNTTTDYARLYVRSTDISTGTMDADFHIQLMDNGTLGDKLVIGPSSAAFTDNLDVGAGLDVTGNITVTGTVDGVDVATIGGYLNQAVLSTSSPTFEDVNVKTKIVHSGDTDTHIDFGSNFMGFDVGNRSIFDLYQSFVIFNEGGNDVDVRMEVSSGATATGMEDLDYAFHLDGGKGIAAFGDAAEDTFRGRVLQIFGNVANGYALWVKNDGDNANRQGLLIQCGAYSSGTGTLINFCDGDGNNVGTVTFSSGTVTYGTFTGVHDAYIMESDGVAENLPSSSLELYYESGTIVSMVSSSKDNTFQPVNFVASSSTYQDKRAYGVYMGSYDWADRDSDYHAELIDKHLIASVGDGFVLVNNQGGDIEIGDYITTASGSGGYGCKQSDDLLHNYTVAKATDGITWSNESTTYKLLACTYHCG
tara:strand:- start:19 stop:2313 length:2295 start_codon:yes stop_codon:yes gene_type:complete